MLWTLKHSRPDGLLALRNPYFERAEPRVGQYAGTYVETGASFTASYTLQAVKGG